MDQGGLRRLAEAVKFRREEDLDIGIAEACRRGGVGPATWVKIEAGEQLSDKMATRVYARVDRALGWAVGSCRAILAGGQATLVEQQTTIPPRLRKAFEQILADPAAPESVKVAIRTQLYPAVSPGSSERTAG